MSSFFKTCIEGVGLNDQTVSKIGYGIFTKSFH
jgi:hypothetical protein